MSEYPRVVLFGAIAGGWREKYVIPLLEELGVSYYNPVSKEVWSTQMGSHEVDLMAHCETIVMVFNRTSPAYAALAETGWAALGAALRGQHLILQIDLDYNFALPDAVRQTEEGQRVEALLNDWSEKSRYLVYHHARQFNFNRLHVVDDMEGVVTALREIYVE